MATHDKTSHASRPTSLDITVVIPTYNGERELPHLLERLRQQITDPTLTWEILVADNNSTDSTADLVRHAQQNWLDRAPLRYTFVPQQGAAFARQAGVEQANGAIVAFLDDDNLPEPDWIQNVCAFAQQHPHVGAFGSATYAVPPLDPALKGIGTYIAVIDRPAGRYEPANKIVPPTAGLAVRRQAWLDAIPRRLFLNFSGSDSAVASEDMEAMFYLQQSGWEIWHNPEMKIGHHLPPDRFERARLLETVRRIGRSRHHLRRIRRRPWERPFWLVAHGLVDRAKLFRHKLVYGEATPRDLAAACQRADLEGTIASPRCIWRIDREYRKSRRRAADPSP